MAGCEYQDICSKVPGGIPAYTKLEFCSNGQHPSCNQYSEARKIRELKSFFSEIKKAGSEKLSDNKERIRKLLIKTIESIFSKTSLF